MANQALPKCDPILLVCVLGAIVGSLGIGLDRSKISEDDGSAAGSCPGSGNCCVSNGTPGCNDFDCCELICFIDSFCCDDEWDRDCADLAIGFCDPGTCSGVGGCPGSGDCCESNGTPGCNDESCCELVCTQDAFCCDQV